MTSSKKSDKVLITGDDILIEYVERIMNALKQVNESSLKVSWRASLDKFISHYVWHNLDAKDPKQVVKPTLWGRLELRLVEMKERRKRLIKHMYKNEGRL